MTRNLISDEIAERNRTEGEGGYTFNAYPPCDYEGFALTVACLRLGDHAHLEVESGRQVIQGDGSPRIHRSGAGHLIFPWHEWLVIRSALDAVPWVRIAEVERPSRGQLGYHLPAPSPESRHGGGT